MFVCKTIKNLHQSNKSANTKGIGSAGTKISQVKMNYFSICDGIGAAHSALLPLGFRCIGISEIDKSCNQLIERKYGFRNYGDFTKWKTWGSINADVFIGGSPCQSFSTLGKREGTKAPTGQLTLDYVDFVCTLCPKFFIWENVAAVLHINRGAVFRYMLAKFSERGYGLGWKILNSRFFGVPQHRRRVFLVGCFGSATSAGEILFETETMSVRPTAIQEPGQDDSSTVTFDYYTDGTQSKMDRHHKRYRQNNPVVGTLTTQICTGAEQVNLIVIDGNRARYLTPLEAERLQGFPDNYTAGFSDTTRYKMVGNSMSVPVIRWIGTRILTVDQKTKRWAKAG